MLAVLTLAALTFAGDLEFKGTGWVNSPDLSLARLKGKIVVLYFFEEG